MSVNQLEIRENNIWTTNKTETQHRHAFLVGQLTQIFSLNKAYSAVTLLTEKCSQILKNIALRDQTFLHHSFFQDAKNKFSEGRTVVFKLH